MRHPHIVQFICKIVIVLSAWFRLWVHVVVPTGWVVTVRLQDVGRCVAKSVCISSDAGWDTASVQNVDQIGSQCEPHHHLGSAAPRVRRLVAEASVAVCGVVGCEGEGPRVRPHWDVSDTLTLQVVCVIAYLVVQQVVRIIVSVTWNVPCIGAIRELTVGLSDPPAVASTEPGPDDVFVAAVAVELALGPAVPVWVAGKPVNASLKTEVPVLDVVAVVFVAVTTEEEDSMPPGEISVWRNVPRHCARQATE